ncbi:hypothetical protein D3C80_2130760 [compost metagenome]
MQIAVGLAPEGVVGDSRQNRLLPDLGGLFHIEQAPFDRPRVLLQRNLHQRRTGHDEQQQQQG